MEAGIVARRGALFASERFEFDSAPCSTAPPSPLMRDRQQPGLRRRRLVTDVMRL